jgi:hypothetical protein
MMTVGQAFQPAINQDLELAGWNPAEARDCPTRLNSYCRKLLNTSRANPRVR